MTIKNAVRLGIKLGEESVESLLDEARKSLSEISSDRIVMGKHGMDSAVGRRRFTKAEVTRPSDKPAPKISSLRPSIFKQRSDK